MLTITPSAMKRSFSALQESQELKVAHQPDMSTSQPSFTLPYDHYAMVYIDHEGNLKVRESQSIQEHESSVFTLEVRQNFLEILGERIYRHRPTRM